jgi:hypothetical protein
VKTTLVFAPAAFAAVTLATTLVCATTPAAPAPAPATSAVCKDDEVIPQSPTQFPLYSPRAFEFWGKVGELGDWGSPGSMRPAGYLGLEGALPFDEQRIRLSLGADFILGHWGDDAHSFLGMQAAAAFRWSPLMDDVFDGYLIVRPADFLFAWNSATTAYRPGLGVGVRVARTVELEATGDALIALDHAFAGGERVAPGLDVTLGFDICFPLSCNQPTPPKLIQVSLACNLYNEAQRVCSRVPDRAALCAAVFTAMDANRPLGPGETQPADPIASFLLSAQGLLPDTAKSTMDSVINENQALISRVGEAQTHERGYAQKGARPVDHCSYAPTAIELRDAFGCLADGGVTPTCPDAGQCP